jgi:hypothetical protein
MSKSAKVTGTKNPKATVNPTTKKTEPTKGINPKATVKPAQKG